MKTIKSNSLFTACLFSIALVGNGFCQTQNNIDKKKANDQNEKRVDSKMEDDSEFLVTAAEGGMFEVQLGKLAQGSAMSPQVKAFAKTMVDEHSKANTELKALAMKKNIVLPTTLSDKLKSKYSDMAEKKGEDFDRVYMECMVKDHKKCVDNFTDESEKGKDNDIKMWANGKIDTLKHHLEMAQSTLESLKTTSSLKKNTTHVK
jgi:putative membrane protein